MRRHFAGPVASAAILLAACDFGLSGLTGGADDAGADADAPPPPAPPPADGSVPDADAASVAPSFVQAVATASFDASAATATFEAGVRPGSTLVVAFDYELSGGAPVTVKDTQNDTFQPVIDWLGGSRHHAVHAAVGVAGGATNVTAQVTSPAHEIELYLHEYAGVGAVGASAGASGTLTGVDKMQTPLVTTTAANTLLFGYGVCGSCVAGTGFTGRTALHDNVTEDRIAATPGDYRATATMTAGTAWSLVVVALAPK